MVQRNESMIDVGYQYPSIEQIREMSLRMQYIPHETRRVIEQSGLADDLTLYWQIILIELCHNHTASRVLQALIPSKGIRKKRQALKKHKSQGDDIPMDVQVAVNDSEVEIKAPMTLLETLKLQDHWTKKRVGDTFRSVAFDYRAMWNLYLIDSLMLISDYTVRFEELVSLLERMDGTTISEMASGMGQVRMYNVMNRMEEHLGRAQSERKLLEESSEIVIEPAQPVDPKSNKILQTAVNELKEFGKLEELERQQDLDEEAI